MQAPHRVVSTPGLQLSAKRHPCKRQDSTEAARVQWHCHVVAGGTLAGTTRIEPRLRVLQGESWQSGCASAELQPGKDSVFLWLEALEPWELEFTGGVFELQARLEIHDPRTGKAAGNPCTFGLRRPPILLAAYDPRFEWARELRAHAAELPLGRDPDSPEWLIDWPASFTSPHRSTLPMPCSSSSVSAVPSSRSIAGLPAAWRCSLARSGVRRGRRRFPAHP